MAPFYLPTRGSFGVLAACISALRAKDIIHCLPLPISLGPLESARADNNSYMSQQVGSPGPLTWSPVLLVPIAFPISCFFLVRPVPLSFGVFCLSLMHVRWLQLPFSAIFPTVVDAPRE